jgi:hypothetical protein
MIACVVAAAAVAAAVAAGIGKQVYEFIDEVPAAGQWSGGHVYPTKQRAQAGVIINAATDFCKSNRNTGAEWWQP